MTPDINAIEERRKRLYKSDADNVYVEDYLADTEFLLNRINDLTTQLAEVKADYEAAVDAMDDLAMGIVCKHCKRDSSTCESGLVYSCARFEYRGRNKGNG